MIERARLRHSDNIQINHQPRAQLKDQTKVRVLLCSIILAEVIDVKCSVEGVSRFDDDRLFEVLPECKLVVHFFTRHRSRIDGETKRGLANRLGWLRRFAVDSYAMPSI